MQIVRNSLSLINIKRGLKVNLITFTKNDGLSKSRLAPKLFGGRKETEGRRATQKAILIRRR